MKNRPEKKKLLISYCGIVCSLCLLYRGKYKKKKCSGFWTLNEYKIVESNSTSFLSSPS